MQQKQNQQRSDLHRSKEAGLALRGEICGGEAQDAVGKMGCWVVVLGLGLGFRV